MAVSSNKTGSVKKQRTINAILAYIALVFLAVLFLFPLLWILSNSLKTYEHIFSYPPKFFPLPLQFKNYINAFTYESLPFGRFLLNSAFITIISVVAVVFSSALVAYAFSHLRWRGRDALFIVVVLTMIIPTEVVITPQYIIYNKLGLLDTYIPLIAPWFFGKAFYIFMIRQTMMGIPKEMNESARIDGCNVIQTFLYVIMPQAKLGMIAVAIMAMQDQWNNYLEPLIFVNTLSKQVISVGLSYFSGMYQTQWNYVFAAAVIVALPILIIFAFFQKYFIQGVVVSGVKG